MNAETISLCTFITTTLGGVLIAWIAYKQRQADKQAEIRAKEIAADLEVAKLAAAKQGKRTRHIARRAKQIEAKTDDTLRQVEAVKKQTNGMQEQLLKEVESRARQEGIAHGSATAIKEAAKEAVKESLQAPEKQG